MKKKKGKKRKKVKFEEEAERHIEVGYGNQSEKVVHMIIEKIISYSITKAEMNRIVSRENVGKMCADYICYMIKNVAKIEVLSYDKDDLDDDSMWSDVIEPERVIYDRHAYNYVEINQNFKDLTELNEDIDSTPKAQNDDRTKKRKSTFFRGRGSLESLTSSKDILKKLPSSIESQSKEDDSSKKRHYAFDFPSYDIPGLVLDRESEEIKSARVGYQKVLQLREERRNKEIEINKKFMSNSRVGVTNSISPLKYKANFFDRNRYTFDPNGKPIRYRLIPVNNLMREFSEVKSSNKFIKKILSPGQVPAPIQNKDPLFPSLPISIEGYKDTRKNSVQKPKDEGSSLLKKFVPPSGDNWEMLSPEIGVVINQENKIKKGDFRFLKKYKKYSSYDFNNELNETMKLNNLNLSSNVDFSLPFQSQEMSLNLSKMNMNMSTVNIETGSKSQRSGVGSVLQKSNSVGQLLSVNHSRISSSVFETLESLPQLDKSENKAKKFCDVFFLKKLELIGKKKEGRNTKKEEKSLNSYELINKFNYSLILKREKEAPEVKRKESPKMPVKVEQKKLIKHNGVFIKPQKSFRVNYPTILQEKHI